MSTVLSVSFRPGTSNVDDFAMFQQQHNSCSWQRSSWQRPPLLPTAYPPDHTHTIDLLICCCPTLPSRDGNGPRGARSPIHAGSDMADRTSDFAAAVDAQARLLDLPQVTPWPGRSRSICIGHCGSQALNRLPTSPPSAQDELLRFKSAAMLKPLRKASPFSSAASATVGGLAAGGRQRSAGPRTCHPASLAPRPCRSGAWRICGCSSSRTRRTTCRWVGGRAAGVSGVPQRRAAPTPRPAARSGALQQRGQGPDRGRGGAVRQSVHAADRAAQGERAGGGRRQAPVAAGGGALLRRGEPPPPFPPPLPGVLCWAPAAPCCCPQGGSCLRLLCGMLSPWDPRRRRERPQCRPPSSE
jgi:hypothetical protein